MSGSPRPPRLASIILALTLPRDVRQAVLGDMAEAFEQRVQRGDEVGARLWYWSHTWRSLSPLARWPLRFGGALRVQPTTSSHFRGDIVPTFLRDVRYALRSALKNPGPTAVIVLTLGLGIGASTAIFSVVDGIMLRPLPFPEPHRLVTVWADYSARTGRLREWLNIPGFYDLRREEEVFEEIAVWGGWGPTLTGLGDAEALVGAELSAGMFSGVLQVPPTLGRAFLPEDDEPGAPLVVMLSHGFWSRVFGGDPNAVGTTVSLNDTPFTVIGVMPPGFRPPFIPAAEVWAPILQNATTNSCGRGCAGWRSFGRLMPGVSLETARERTAALARRLGEEFPQSNTGVGYALFPMHTELVREASTALWVLLGAVGLVLLIACVNVANLLLARTTVRQSELAVRAALGAERGRIMRQLLTESTVLALLGGSLGMAIAAVGTKFLVALAPAGTPRIGEVVVDLRILAFAGAITMLSTFLFGLLPALRASRTDLHEVLKTGGRGQDIGIRGRMVTSGLVVGQVAIALMLLVGAGLLLRSLSELNSVDLGFDEENVLTVQLGLPSTRYPDRAASTTFFLELERRLGAMPGVTSVGATNTIPLSGNDGDVNFHVEGTPLPAPGEAAPAVWFRRVTPGYFETMGIRIVRGRAFRPGDDPQAPRVIMINETLAAQHFPDQNPVGLRINVNSRANPVWREIVGVAQDVKNFGVTRGSRNAMYAPYSQVASPFMTMVMRTSVDPASLIPTARSVVAAMDPNLASGSMTPMKSIVRGSLGSERFITQLLSLFAAVALLLAVVGLYGVVSYSVSRRIHEIGVRIALGAADGDIRKLIVGKSLALVAVGVGTGVAGALLLTRTMAGLLFGVSATDPTTFGATVVLLGVVAAVASAIPAQRAVRVDPITVLRDE